MTPADSNRPADTSGTDPTAEPSSACATVPTIQDCLDSGGAIPFTPDNVVRVVTPASVWLLEAHSYVRLPRIEGPRPRTESINGRLDDGIRHRHRGLWWSVEFGTLHVRILPVDGPEHGLGVMTGIVETASGIWSEGHHELEQR